MALDDAATLVPAVGHYFFNPTINAPKPADPMAPATPYVEVGHTAYEDPFTITSEGGDQSTLPTWQNKSLRTTYATRVESLAFQLMQWDAENYKLYWGSNATTDTDGWVQVPNDPTPTEGTLFARIDDGAESVAFWFPHVSIYRADDITADPEALMGLPVSATVLGVSANTFVYAVAPKGELAPAGG